MCTRTHSVLAQLLNSWSIFDIPHTHTHTHTRGHKGTIWSMVTHRNLMYSGSSDGTIKVWATSDLRKGCLKTVAAHKDCVSPTIIMCVEGVLYGGRVLSKCGPVSADKNWTPTREEDCWVLGMYVIDIAWDRVFYEYTGTSTRAKARARGRSPEGELPCILHKHEDFSCYMCLYHDDPLPTV